jgi:hypothetical protein
MECKEVVSVRITGLYYTAVYLCVYAYVQYKWPDRFRALVGGSFGAGFIFGVTVGVWWYAMYFAHLLKDDIKRC